MIINIVIFRIRFDGRVLFVRILQKKKDCTAKEIGGIEIQPFNQLIVKKKKLTSLISHPPITLWLRSVNMLL